MNFGDILGLSANPQVSQTMKAMLGIPSNEGPRGVLYPEQNTMPMAGRDPMRAASYEAKQDSGLRKFLGNLGDALLIGSGLDPIYKPAVERREMGAKLANYLGANDPGLAQVLMQNPEMGLKLYNASREDKRFDRTASQDDRRIDQGDRQIEQGDRRLTEQERSNQRGEYLTERGQNITVRGQDISAETTRRGQDVSSTTQMKLADLRARSEAAGRAQAAALRQGDYAHAERMAKIKHGYDVELSGMRGGGDTVTETVIYPGQEAKPDTSWFGDNSQPAVPERKVVTKRSAQSQQARTVTAQELQQYAKSQGRSVSEARAFLEQQGYKVR